MKDKYTAQDDTQFDTRWRGENVDLYVAGDNTIIASPAKDSEGGEADESEATD